MARIAKSDVHAALRRAADHLIEAGGPDRRVSRADVKQRLTTLVGIERALVDMLFRFIDHRDYQPGATVTVADVEEAYAYAREKLIDAYDANNNGFSAAEVTKMSTIGKLAVALAVELGADAEAVDLESFDPVHVEAELVELTRGLTLISESDGQFKPIVVPLAPSASLDLETMRLLFADVHDELGDGVFGYDRTKPFDLAFADAEERDFGEWFAQRRLPDDLLDPFAVELAVRTGELVDYLAAQIHEPRVFAYADSNQAGQLSGPVSVFIVGRTPSGWLVGVYTISVET